MIFFTFALFVILGYSLYVVISGRYYFLFSSIVLLASLLPSMRNYELTERAFLIRFWGIAKWIPNRQIMYDEIDQIVPYYARSGKLQGIRINYVTARGRSWVNVGSNIDLPTFYVDLQKRCSLPG